MARYCGTVVGCDSGFRGSDEHPCWPSQIFWAPRTAGPSKLLFFEQTAHLSREKAPQIGMRPCRVPQGRNTLAHSGNCGERSAHCKKPRAGATQALRAPCAPASRAESALASSKMEVLWNVHLHKKGEGGIPMQKQIPRASALVMTAFRGERPSEVSGGRSLRVARMPG